MILTKVRPSLYMPLWVCLWSVISGTTAAAQNNTHLFVIRFFLGIAEAPFFPGAFYLLSCWYTRRELALRTAVLYSALILATGFSGLIAAGVFSGLDGACGLAGWRWLFIIEGAMVGSMSQLYFAPFSFQTEHLQELTSENRVSASAWPQFSSFQTSPKLHLEAQSGFSLLLNGLLP